jgi:hypothetical protein
MLKTVVIPKTLGRVCYLDAFGENPTIECYSSKTAFKVMIMSKSPVLLVGDWVKFSGNTRIGKTKNKRTGLTDGIRNYYHYPSDGSSKDEWSCLELRDAICTVVVHSKLTSSMSIAINQITSCIEEFDNNRQNKDVILSTIDSMNTVTKTLRKVYRDIMVDEDEKNAKPIRIPRISVDDP